MSATPDPATLLAETLAALTSEGELSSAEQTQLLAEAEPAVPVPSVAEREESPKEEVETDIRKILADANFGVKVKYALLGNATCRALLIRDTNKIIQMMVLKNPRIAIGEVEDFAKNSNLSEKVLRAIGDNKAFTRSYRVKVNLVSNPRTPGDVALRWLKFLQPNDLRTLARSKNVAQIVATMARKMVQEQQEKGG